MKKTSVSFFFVLLCVVCFGQTNQTSCGDFKSGRFAYRDSTNGIIEVIRKGNRQQEYDPRRKTITKFKISWVSDCEYHLTQVWSNSKEKRKQNRSVTTVLITHTNGSSSYEYDCGCKDRKVAGRIGLMVRMDE